MTDLIPPLIGVLVLLTAIVTFATKIVDLVNATRRKSSSSPSVKNVGSLRTEAAHTQQPSPARVWVPFTLMAASLVILGYYTMMPPRQLTTREVSTIAICVVNIWLLHSMLKRTQP